MNFEWYEDFRVTISIPQRLEPRRHRQQMSSQCAFFSPLFFFFSFFAPNLGPCLVVPADVTSLEIEKLRVKN